MPYFWFQLAAPPTAGLDRSNWLSVQESRVTATREPEKIWFQASALAQPVMFWSGASALNAGAGSAKALPEY